MRRSRGGGGNDVPDFLLEELGSQIFNGGGAGGGEGGSTVGDGGLELNEDVERITRWWIQEEASPELLPFQAEAVAELHELVERQQGFVDESRNTVDEASSALLYQMEIDRVKFILARYLRARLRKIEKRVLHIALSPEMRQRLSEAELAFATGYLDMVDRHAHDMVLDHLPEGFQSLTQEAHGERPVDGPDLDQFVFVRVKRDVGRVQVDDSADAASNVAGVQDLAAGDVHVLKYRVVRPLLLSEDVELI